MSTISLKYQSSNSRAFSENNPADAFSRLKIYRFHVLFLESDRLPTPMHRRDPLNASYESQHSDFLATSTQRTYSAPQRYEHHLQVSTPASQYTLHEWTFRSRNPVDTDTAFKVLVRPMYAGAVWNPYLVKDIYAIESVQRRASRLICRSVKEYTERLGESWGVNI